MLPSMTMTATATEAGADAPNDLDVMKKFALLTDEEKEKVILYVEQLKADRYNR